MQILEEKLKRTRLRTMDEIPESINIRENLPAELRYPSGSKMASCIKCSVPHCIFIDSEKIRCNELKEFPGDTDNKVCPVDAISWDEEKEFPVIDSNVCIGCGLCASQCPVGAIFKNETGITINYESDGYSELEYMQENVERQIQSINQIQKLTRCGNFIQESDPEIEKIYEKVIESKILPEKFVRNIMVALGNNCATRRIGDVYVRMDAIYSSPKGSFGAIEVEFGTDTLSAARGILDDIAVLHSRYNIDKHDNTTLVACFSLPNIRQGYWQVVKDIATVENIKINTISLGALLLLLWNQKSLNLKDAELYADYDNPTIRKQLEEILGRKIDISDKLLGVLEPVK